MRKRLAAVAVVSLILLVPATAFLARRSLLNA
jgi:hypothetical protein